MEEVHDKAYLKLSLSLIAQQGTSQGRRRRTKSFKISPKWHHLQWSKDLCVALGSCHPLWNDVTLHLPCNVISVSENSNPSIHPNKFVFLPNFKPNRKAHPKLDSMAIISSNDWTNEWSWHIMIDTNKHGINNRTL